MKPDPQIVISLATDGHGNYIGCKPITRTIEYFYLGIPLRCKDSAGDVWCVRKGADNKYYTMMETIK